jgi:hypothetical protein
MTQPQQSMNALVGQILTPADHMVMGGQLSQAGIDDAEISNLIGLIERTASENARQAARDTALSLLPVFIDLIKKTHATTDMDIHRRLTNKTAGFGGLVTHRDCAQIALDVANGTPSHVPAQARPIIGSIR